MKRKIALILAIFYLVLTTGIVVLGMTLPTWTPLADTPVRVGEITTPTDMNHQQTSEAGFAALEAKIESGLVHPSNQDTPVPPGFDDVDPAYPSQGEATDFPANTNTPLSTTVPIQTSTFTLQAGWVGQWIVWFQQDDKTYISGELTIEIIDTDLSGSAILGGSLYEFEGSITSNGEKVSGIWIGPAGSGSFAWALLSDGKFSGSRDDLFGFCGFRLGLTPPDPCYLSPNS